MRLPNGYGSITKLSGKRRNPYAAYPPATRRYPNGNYIKEKAIGFYHTKKEALEALADWHKNPILCSKSTFAEIWQVWYEEKKKDNLSDQTEKTYRTMYGKCDEIKDEVYSDLRIQDFQDILDYSEFSWSSQNTLRSMLKQIGVFALKNDYVQKDYAQFIKVRKENDQVKGIPFTESDIDKLWHNVDRLKGIKEVLILIYTGLRITELKQANIDLENRLIIGGVKTDAGKGRVVPIHPAIYDLLVEFNQKSFYPPNYRKKIFNPLMEKLGIRFVGDVPHTPHDCRHTFSWLADKYKMDKLSKHLIMGHSPKGIEDAVYGHRTTEELRTEIEKIKV